VTDGFRPSGQRRGVLLAVSGGVDSGVAALRLLQQGYWVEAVTFSLWTDPDASKPNRCCAADAILAARDLADHLGIVHHLVDLREEFLSEVVSYFVETYADARTPNPCVQCNAHLRFPVLVRMAEELGLDHISTGHYARLDPGSDCLLRGHDNHKDQSYVLAHVSPALLRQSLFPVGDLTKGEVRACAREHGLPVHASPESQDICFIPDGDYRRFLATRIRSGEGPILDREGKVRGTHSGLYRYTIGQRRGLGIADTEPLYVVELRPSRNALVVGRWEDLEVTSLELTDVVVHAPLHVGDDAPTVVQYRSTGDSVPVVPPRYDHDTDSLLLTLKRPAQGVSPGQLAVVYQGASVLLSGTILCASPRTGGRVEPAGTRAPG